MARKGSVKYLHKAKTAKNDEFYTILSDIEKNSGTIKNTSRIKWCFVIVTILGSVISSIISLTTLRNSS